MADPRARTIVFPKACTARPVHRDFIGSKINSECFHDRRLSLALTNLRQMLNKKFDNSGLGGDSIFAVVFVKKMDG